MRNSLNGIKDDLGRGTKGYKTVIALEDEGLLFNNEEIKTLYEKLNSSGSFIDVGGDFFINKKEILAVLPMDQYLKRKLLREREKEQLIKSRKPTLP